MISHGPDDVGDDLTYTLTGTDAESFDINWGTGQILTKAALNEETKASNYSVTVRATDPAGIPSGSFGRCREQRRGHQLTISITDVNEAPTVAGDAEVAFRWKVTGDIETAPLHTYTATDLGSRDTPTPTWSVAGADGAKFTAAGGALMFKAKPDFESPTDADRDNVYEVTVQASDGRLTGMMAVTVTVTNENENGVVTLSKTQPRVGIPVTASLTDPDGSISKLTWQWSIAWGHCREMSPTPDGNIDGATSDTYVPKDGDEGGTLTATASYTDGHGLRQDCER